MFRLPKGAKILGQGITGYQGSTELPWMLSYGMQVVGGVRPGKGGEVLLGVPIFDTVKEAIETVDLVDGTVLYTPPMHTLSAVKEALEAGLKWVLITAEKVPTKDGSIIYALAKEHNACVIGPTSVGLINPQLKIKIGSIGGSDPSRAFVPGEVAIVSKSGGMSSEIGLHLKNNGLGVSWAVGIGGDRIASMDFADFLMELEEDDQTKTSVIFGELGGTYEEKVAEMVRAGKIKKPVVAFIAGEFTQTLPSEVQFGHAGAIIEGNRGRPDYKRQVLKEAGVKVAENFDEIANLVKEVLRNG
ncbi:hypothetical protein A2688_01580 [Candidatus Daviesbacteria bacterium RIFCSPHIGHO2_01_FULL_38_8]|nr:MAG: hypothetical protein A2688_01580 [Candidatus Daviesbacteria bacterium RIFCSPHIGHO2_01_FULL_38_8]